MAQVTVGPVARTQIEIPYIHGHDYGVGTDFLSGTPLALAVVPDHSPPGAPGGVLTFRASRITSTEDVEDKLGIHADASYGIGFFGAISARFDFARSCRSTPNRSSTRSAPRSRSPSSRSTSRD